jgi:acetate kinase
LTRIGGNTGRFTVRDAGGESIVDDQVAVSDHDAACDHVFSWILSNGSGKPDAIGHRMVHGGPRHSFPEAVTPELIASIEELSPYAPEHLPQALKAVRHAGTVMPGVLQVACFDTAFHRSMPSVAQLYPLPEAIRREGVQRYGFHGLSYEYLLSELARLESPEALQGRIILAHLGHGASMAAVRNGRSIETSMGFSPAGGLVMSTRTGDLDPGVILFLLQQDRLSPAEIKEMVNRRSGLFGVSGRSDDMRDLLEAEVSDEPARQAVELFCYQARKYIGSLTAVLGGIDMLVFTGGIGEHSPDVRGRICEGLEFFGIQLDHEKNRMNLPLISHEKGRVSVRVMKTNEELMIVRQTRNILEEHA